MITNNHYRAAAAKKPSARNVADWKTILEAHDMEAFYLRHALQYKMAGSAPDAVETVTQNNGDVFKFELFGIDRGYAGLVVVSFGMDPENLQLYAVFPLDLADIFTGTHPEDQDLRDAIFRLREYRRSQYMKTA